MISIRSRIAPYSGWLLGLVLISCAKQPTYTSSSPSVAPYTLATFDDPDILFVVGEDTITTEEFTYVFEKNSINREDSDLQQELDEYLELYINFKLKVLEAEALGYPERSAFQREFGQYRDQLATSYLTDHNATDMLVEEAYNRLKEEINAAHLLILVDETATPQDTLAAYEKVMAARQRIVEGGEDFETVAREVSEDPSVVNNGGNLGYFSALRMVYPFENAAFNTPVGEVSMPVRTQFGYHLLHIKDRRSSVGKIQVSHIMIRATEGMPEEQMEAAQNKIEDIAGRLEAGENWFELCRQFSEDVRTKARGGLLPMFGSGEMVVEFEEAAFALDEVGDISAPVQTAYGWHIIRLEDRQGLSPLNEMQADLKERIARDSRSEITQQAFIARLERENQLEENEMALEQIRLLADSSLLRGEWGPPANMGAMSSQTLFSLGGGEVAYEVGDFFDYVSSKQGRSPYQDPAQYMQVLYERYREDGLLQYERDHLAEKYEDYRYLIKEYRDGILLFQLMDDQIWSKAVEDTTGLRQYFEANADAYRWEERATALILNAASEDVLDEALAFVDDEYYPTPVYEANISFTGPIRMVGDQQRQVLSQAMTIMANDPMSQAEFLIEVADADSAGYRTIFNYLTQRGTPVDRLMPNFLSTDGESTITLSVMSTRAKAMENYFNASSALALVVKEGLYERSQEAIFAEVPWEVGTHTVTWDNRNYAVVIRDIMEGSKKELNEVRGGVISDYQDYLEREWLNELREKYPVRLNDDGRKAVYESYGLE